MNSQSEYTQADILIRQVKNGYILTKTNINTGTYAEEYVAPTIKDVKDVVQELLSKEIEKKYMNTE